jgi:hypothetical protein
MRSASDLLRYRDDRADIIDMMTLHAGERRRVVREQVSEMSVIGDG